MPDKNSLSGSGSLRSGRAYPTAGDADLSAGARGLASLGRGIAGAGAALEAKQEKDERERDALDLIRAEQAQRQGLFETERALDSDGDYATHDKRYTEGATGITDRAAGLIRNPQMREKWRLKADNDIISGRERVGNRVDAYAKQDRLVQLETSLETSRNQFTDPATSDEQRGAIAEQMKTAIELGKRSGMVSPVAAQKLNENYVKGAIKQDAERRLLDDPEGLRRDLLGDAAPRGEVEPGNIDLSARPVVKNADGSISTLKSISIEEDGREVVIPTIDPDGKEMTEGEAITRYLGSGEHLGKFNTRDEATAWAKRLFDRQARTFKPAKGASPEQISMRLETGKTDPLRGVTQIADDSKGSKSYGNFGLNSQGSAQAFVKTYGRDLGLRGEPGSAEFDRSWRAVASADPQGLHAAEMAWYRAEILEPTVSDLTDAGVPTEMAGDPRVVAYFADRKVQQGPGSIDDSAKHRARIQAASNIANGDVGVFLNAMNTADRNNLKADFPTALATGVYSEKGHANRLQGRLDMALGMDDTASAGYPQATGRYAELSPLERSDLLSKAERSHRQRFEGQREQLKQQLDDDIASIRNTGTSAQPDLEMARRVLEPNQVNRYFINREEALMEYEATNDLPTLTNSQLSSRLESIRPAPGEAFYEAKAKIFEKAEKQANDLRELRDIDPARSVESLPEVRKATEHAANNPGNPEVIQQLARARIDAQARVGIPEEQRVPITKTEARVAMAPTRGLEGEALTTAMLGVTEQFRTQYGPYARAAGTAAIKMITHNQELAQEIQGQLDSALSGLPVSASSQRRAEHYTESMQASRSLGGDFVGEPMRQYGAGIGDTAAPNFAPDDPFQAFRPRPSVTAIEALRANPMLSGEFNAKYGNGMAENLLATPIEQLGLAPNTPGAQRADSLRPAPPPPPGMMDRLRDRLPGAN